MAAVFRQPFAPIDGARLQTLTSTKNRQNAVFSPAAKRKAPEVAEMDDSENVDPDVFHKRSKGSDAFPTKNSIQMHTLSKAYSFQKTVKPVKPIVVTVAAPVSSLPQSRAMLKPRAPSTKLNTDRNSLLLPVKASSSATSSHAASAVSGAAAGTSTSTSPSGRGSVTRGSRRSGLLSTRRRATAGMTRVNPPSSKLATAAPFSLDAALKGTLSAFSSTLLPTPVAAPTSSAASLLSTSLGASLGGVGMEPSWFFDIHEDTPEQEMTNLLQHSTCVLDISSDEESEQKARRERAEGRDKENIPPPNDISQVSRARNAAAISPADATDMYIEKARNPLSQLNAVDFYAEGCDEASVVLVQDDESEAPVEAVEPAEAAETTTAAVESVAEVEAALAEDSNANTEIVEAIMSSQEEDIASVEALMSKREDGESAAVLQPMEGTGETFDLWESGSAKGDEASVSQQL